MSCPFHREGAAAPAPTADAPPAPAPAPPENRHTVADDTNILISEEDLECPVCLRLLHAPTTLPCGHTFCSPCLSQTVRPPAGVEDEDESGAPPSSSNQISCRCPICRRESAFDELPQRNALLSALIAKHLPQAMERREAEAARDAAEERRRSAITRQFRVSLQPYYGQRCVVIATEGQSRCPMSRGGTISIGFYVAVVDVRFPPGSNPPSINFRPTVDEHFSCSFSFQPPPEGEANNSSTEGEANAVITTLHFQPRFQVQPQQLRLALPRYETMEETSVLSVEFDSRLVHN
mmetsp:Transcript_34188/g.100654  ORF Transcript_34188/g.100654 Transcript_34188/m.100654 type:complete len:292 (-) Transcript_34188:1153-2028(-)